MIGGLLVLGCLQPRHVLADAARCRSAGTAVVMAGPPPRESASSARGSAIKRCCSARNCRGDHALDGVGQGNVGPTSEVALTQRVTVEVVKY